MRILMLMLAATLPACSRADAGATDQRHKIADVRAREPAHDAHELQGPPHAFAIPIGFGGALTPGAEPSADHPAGTVYFDGVAPGSRGVTLAEWDLASGKAIRRTMLPLDRDDHAAVLANAAGSLHFVQRGLDDRTHYLRLSPELRVLSNTVVDDLHGRDAHAVASDGTVTVIVGPYWSPDGTAGDCFANTYDENGKLLGHRSLRDDGASQLVAWMVHNAVVMDGRVYILIERSSGEPDDGLHIVEYTANLVPITSTFVPEPPPGAPHVMQWWGLRAHEGRLVAEVPPARYEFSADLADMKEGARRARERQDVEDASCDDYVHMGPVRAAVCLPNGHGPNLIAWDRQDEAP